MVFKHLRNERMLVNTTSKWVSYMSHIQFGRDLILKSFFVGDVLGFRTTQSTPSTLVGATIRFFIGVFFTTFSVGATMVTCGGDFARSIVFVKDWDCDLSLPLLTIEVSCGSIVFSTTISFALMRSTT